MKKKIEWLCRDILSDPIRIVVGELGEANEDVVQAVEVMKNGHQKWTWLLSHIVEFTSGLSGNCLLTTLIIKVLVFSIKLFIVGSQ